MSKYINSEELIEHSQVNDDNSEFVRKLAVYAEDTMKALSKITDANLYQVYIEEFSTIKGSKE